jgi:hypothetical protein
MSIKTYNFKLLFNVKLIYTIHVLGPWLWGDRLFFFFSGGAETQWGKWGREKMPWYQAIFPAIILRLTEDARLYLNISLTTSFCVRRVSITMVR